MNTKARDNRIDGHASQLQGPRSDLSSRCSRSPRCVRPRKAKRSNTWKGKPSCRLPQGDRLRTRHASGPGRTSRPVAGKPAHDLVVLPGRERPVRRNPGEEAPVVGGKPPHGGELEAAGSRKGFRATVEIRSQLFFHAATIVGLIPPFKREFPTRFPFSVVG